MRADIEDTQNEIHHDSCGQKKNNVEINLQNTQY